MGGARVEGLGGAGAGAEGTEGGRFTGKQPKAEARGGGLGAGVVGAEIEAWPDTKII